MKAATSSTKKALHSCSALSVFRYFFLGVPPGRSSANSPELLIRLARAGAGITAVPDFFAKPFVQRGELRRVLREWQLPAHKAWVVFPGRRPMPAKTRAFIDMLLAALGDASFDG